VHRCRDVGGEGPGRRGPDEERLPRAVDQWEAQKSRFRKTTAKGVEIAVSIDRNTHIRDGDVLLWDARALSAVVARIELRDVMVVHLDELMAGQLA
jgi:urease accessory protein UreE